MLELARGAHRSHGRLLCLTTFACLILFSLLSTGSRAARALRESPADERLRRWPAKPYAENYLWVEQRTRGNALVGWIELPGAPGGYHREKIAADLRQIIKPAWLSSGREPVSLITFDEDRDRDEVRAEIKAMGFRKVYAHPVSRVAVAAMDRHSRPAESRMPRITRSDHFWGGLKLFGLALLPAFLVFRRRRTWSLPNRPPDRLPNPSPLAFSPARLLAALSVTGVSLRSGLLAVLGVPYALAGACALADSVGGSAAATTVIFVGLIGAWSMLCTQVYLPVTGDPDSLSFRPASLDASEGASLFRWSAAGLLALGAGGLLLRFGFHVEGMIDAIAMYNARARAIVLDPAFMGPFVPPEGAHSLHPDYPPVLAFAVAGAYVVAGSFSFVAPAFVQLCFWVGGGGLLLAWAHRRAGRAAVLCLIALLAVLPHWQERTVDQCCDVPLGLTWMAAMTVWYRRRTATVAAATGLLLGGTLLMKNEGLLLVSAWLLAALVTSPKSLLARPRRAAALFAGLGAAAVLLLVFDANVPPSDLLGRLSRDHLSRERSLRIAQRFWESIVWPGTYGWTFAITIVACALLAYRGIRTGLRGHRQEPWPDSLRALPVAIAVVITGYFAVYAMTSYEIEWYLRTSCDRLFAQIYPATLMLGVAIAGYVAPLAEDEESGDAILIPAPNQRTAPRQVRRRSAAAAPSGAEAAAPAIQEAGTLVTESSDRSPADAGASSTARGSRGSPE